jgi:hypothetical protein
MQAFLNFLAERHPEFCREAPAKPNATAKVMKVLLWVLSGIALVLIIMLVILGFVEGR